MIIALIILSVFCFIQLLYIAWNLHKTSIKQLKSDALNKEKEERLARVEAEHESQLQELEELFKLKINEFQKAIDESDTYITFFMKYFDQLSKIIRISDAKIKEVDHKGAFKSDDEIGFFFENIKEIQDTLNEFDLTRPVIRKILDKQESVSPIDSDGKGIIPADETYIPFDKVQELIK